MTIYDFSVLMPNGEMRSLVDFKGKVLLIVNTASRCGFTPQYQQLQALQDKLGSGKFTVLAFPCNQFGNQEPASNAEITTLCKVNYGVTFPVMAKVNVNGNQAEPLFTYLKSECRGIIGTKCIKWNFTKFLIDSSGKPVKRYAPIVYPNRIIEKIQVLL
jgi:glutathione peroxidase